MSLVLIVDDNDAIRRLVSKILEREGFQIDEALDGNEALACLEDGRAYAAIVLDLMMPHTTGFQVISTLRERRPELLPRVVVMTAAVSEVDSAELEGVGAIISKPFEIDALVESVKSCAASA